MFAHIKSQIVDICAEASYALPATNRYDTGAPGLRLEQLFGIAENNHDTADLPISGVELKYKGPSKTPITMMHLDPIERVKRATKHRARMPGAVERLISQFGYINDNGLQTFRHMVRGATPTTGNRVCGFFVKIEDDRINVYHVSRNTPVAFWFTDVVTNALTSKMRRLIVVEGERDRDEVSYNSATLYVEPRSSQIIDLIADGTILIDFDARFNDNGSVRSHGVKFRIHRADLPKLYRNSEVIVADI